MPSAPVRAILGFIAAVISVLTFHQGMVALLHGLGVSPFPAYSLRPMPPFGVPWFADLAFWGGVYGLVFGLLLPRLPSPLWLCGVALGIVAALVGLFVVAALKGLPIAGGWQAWPIVRSLIINGFWGLGVGLILPWLLPRGWATRAHPA